MRACQCGASLEGRHPSAKSCGKRCYDQARRAPALAKRVAAAIEARPRCMICDAPIRYGHPGIRYSARTCGDLKCANKAFRWFGPGSPRARTRDYSREWMRRRRAVAAA